MITNARLRILVVDDDASVADTISDILRETGFGVTTFYDPLHVVQHALESEPHAVVTDYSMPNMNGLELATWLQKLYPACKIVILTGQATVVADQPADSLKFTLLQKPIPPLALIQAVQ